MPFVYFTKEKTISTEKKLSKEQVKSLFHGLVIVRKTWWRYKYKKRHSKGKGNLRYKLPKSKIIDIVKISDDSNQ